MVLNFIWIGFFVIAFVTALSKLIFWGDLAVFPAMVDSLFEMAQLGATLSLGYIGLMALWLGIMKIGELGGAVAALTRLVQPFFGRLFPEVPKGHPAMGSMMMNFSANMLGLDNAATPLGLKAMGQLQELNPEKDRTTNAQIMFLVLNTSGLTLIPVSIISYRALNGAANPTDIFVPILIATYFASLIGLIAVAIAQKINLLHPVVLAYLLGASALVVGVILYFRSLDQAEMASQSRLAAALFIFGLITGFLVLGMIRRVNIYDAFIEGAKDGFGVAIKIIPYLVAMLVAIGVFRASGAMDAAIEGIAWSVAGLGFDTQWVDALPTAMMKPLSGAGARGLMIETMEHHGPDSFVARLACTFQGSTETTFYTLAVYFGAVSVRNTRYTVVCGLLADCAGFIAAIAVAYLFFA